MLDDLTAEEVVTMGHVVRMLPGNAMLMGGALTNNEPVYIYDLPHFTSLVAKLRQAIEERDDIAPYRTER